MRLVTTPARQRFDQAYATEILDVTRLAFLLVSSQAVAEELAHDAFLRFYERLEQVENPAGFLRTAVTRLALTWLRRNDMEGQRLAVLRQRDLAGSRPPGDVTEIDETWEALGQLSTPRRTVLVLRFYEDLSYQEIADLLGCSAATVRSRVRRALIDLRKELDR